MVALAGLTSLYGTQDTAPAGHVDEGAYQVYTQGTPDPGHASTGDTSGQVWPAGYGVGYKGQGTYESTGVLGEFSEVPGADYGDLGGALDYTPSSHGGLWPRPEATNISTLTPDTSLPLVGIQAEYLHGKEQGGSIAFSDAPGGHEEPTNTTTDRYDAPDESFLRKATGQLRGLIGGIGAPSGGSHLGQADVDQGYGELNTLSEFQGGHSIRVVQHDTMHFDQTGLRNAEEGVWLGKHPVGTQMQFDGPDSPYGVQGNSQGNFGPEVRGYPTEYASPPAPTVLPSTTYGADVFASAGI